MWEQRERDRLQLAAAWSRVVLGAFCLLVLPMAYPGLAAFRWLIGSYIAYALVGQVLIHRGIGGMARSVVGGLVDLALLTFLVHRVGSASTMLVAIYFFAAIVNTLVVGRRVGVALASFASLAYGSVLLLEAFGVLPYGPDAPGWARGPSLSEVVVTAGLVSILLVSCAAVVGMVVSRVREKELELVAANRRLAELSQRDPLTKLYNRRHLMMRLEDELARHKRGHALSVLMIDLDRFKRVNDEQGHLEGDAVLCRIADAIGAATREIDIPGRYGGDEFVILLPDTGLDEAETVAKRLVAAIREVGLTVDPDLPVTASVGVATPVGDPGARELIQIADMRAYQAKRRGGDQVALDRGATTSGEGSSIPTPEERPSRP